MQSRALPPAAGDAVAAAAGASAAALAAAAAAEATHGLRTLPASGAAVGANRNGSAPARPEPRCTPVCVCRRRCSGRWPMGDQGGIRPKQAGELGGAGKGRDRAGGAGRTERGRGGKGEARLKRLQKASRRWQAGSAGNWCSDGNGGWLLPRGRALGTPSTGPLGGNPPLPPLHQLPASSAGSAAPRRAASHGPGSTRALKHLHRRCGAAAQLSQCRHRTQVRKSRLHGQETESSFHSPVPCSRLFCAPSMSAWGQLGWS